MSPGSVSSSNCPYCPSEEPQYSMIDVMNELKAKFSPDDNLATAESSSVSSSTSSTSVSSNDSCGPCSECRDSLRRGEHVPVLGGVLCPSSTAARTSSSRHRRYDSDSDSDSDGCCSECRDSLRRGESVPVLGGWLHPSGTNVDLRNDRDGTSVLVSTAPSVSSGSASSASTSSSATTGTEKRPFSLIAELANAFNMPEQHPLVSALSKQFETPEQQHALEHSLDHALSKARDNGPAKDIIDLLLKQINGVPKNTTQSTASSTTGAVGPESATRSTTGAAGPEGVKEPANPFIGLFKLVSKGMEKPIPVSISKTGETFESNIENVNTILSSTATAPPATTGGATESIDLFAQLFNAITNGTAEKKSANDGVTASSATVTTPSTITGGATEPIDLFAQLFKTITNGTGTTKKSPSTGGTAVSLTPASSNPFELRINLSTETSNSAADVVSNIVKNSKIDSAIDTLKVNLLKDLEKLLSPSSAPSSALSSTAPAADDDSDSCRSAHPCYDPQNPGEDSSSCCSMSWTPASSSASSSIDDGSSSSISESDRPCPGCALNGITVFEIFDCGMNGPCLTCPTCRQAGEPVDQSFSFSCGNTNVVGGSGKPKMAKGKPTAGTSGAAPASSGPQPTEKPAGMTKAELKAGMLALSEVKECIVLLGQEAVEEYIDTLVNLPEMSFGAPYPILTKLFLSNPMMIANSKVWNGVMVVSNYYSENCPNYQEVFIDTFLRLLVECFAIYIKPQVPEPPIQNLKFADPIFWYDDIVPIRCAPRLIELETTITNSRFSTLNFSQKHALRQRWTDYRNDKNSSLSPARRHRVLTMAMGYYQSNTIMTPIEYIQSLPKSFTKGVIDDLCYLINPF